MDNIFKGRIALSKEPGWHRLGTVFQDRKNVTQAMETARMLYSVEKRPVFYQAADGSFKSVETKFAIVREQLDDDPEAVFGVVGREWTPLQNADIARMLDPLCEYWPAETAGALGRGEAIFVSLDAGTNVIAGEEVHDYFLMSEGKTGGSSITFAYTPVRVVCQNTLITGLRAATTTASIVHRSGVADEFQFRVNVMTEMRLSRQRSIAAMERLAHVKLTEEQVEQVLVATYPSPKRSRRMDLLDEATEAAAAAEATAVDEDMLDELKSAAAKFEFYQEKTRVLRVAVQRTYEQFNDEQPQLAQTGWALWQAVVEAADWRHARTPRLMAIAATWGHRASEKKRAFAEISSLIS